MIWRDAVRSTLDCNIQVGFNLNFLFVIFDIFKKFIFVAV